MGRAACTLLAAEKANLVIASHDADGIAQQAEELSAAGADVLAKTLDVTEESQVAALFEEAKQLLEGSGVQPEPEGNTASEK